MTCHLRSMYIFVIYTINITIVRYEKWANCSIHDFLSPCLKGILSPEILSLFLVNNMIGTWSPSYYLQNKGIISFWKEKNRYRDHILMLICRKKRDNLVSIKKNGNGDLISIGNIYIEWRQDDFQNFCLVPIQKIWQWGSCLHQ